jgi:mono/diheme cytochrome c family protein
VRGVIASAALVLGFILVGATVLFFAFGGGAHGAREQLHAGQTRRGRRVALLGIFATIAVFGAGIPALVIAFNGDAQSDDAVGGVTLSSKQQDGRELFATKCANCHTLKAANAVGRVGPNLDNKQGLNRALVVDAITNGRAQGQGQMPASLLSGEDVDNVASFVAAVAGRG